MPTVPTIYTESLAPLKTPFIRAAMNALGRIGVDVRLVPVPRNAFIADGMISLHNHSFVEEPRFARAYERAIVACGADYCIPWRTHVALHLARSAMSVKGDFIELGTGKGWMFSAILDFVDWNDHGKQLWLLDRFLPWEVDPLDGTPKSGELRSAYYADGSSEVKANFSEWKGVNVLEGSLPNLLGEVASTSFAFVHVDLNAAEPEVNSLRVLWPRISAGGFVLLDDYGYLGYEPQFAAMNSLANELNFSILSLPTGQGLILKPTDI